jgi:hypothetical protein
MALVPGILTINWTSNYIGPHRVCYRIVGAPSYTCSIPGVGPGTNPICPGNGGPCTYDINLLVDNETCDTINYEGYVQAACEDVASLVGRVAFVASFVPSPACKRWSIECVDSGVENNVFIKEPGSGYTDGVYPGLPQVVGTGGGGLGATFDVTVAGGVITAVVVATPGSGYTLPCEIDISSIPFVPGILADFTVYLVGCAALDVYDCDDVTTETIAAGVLQPGDIYEMCGSVEPASPGYMVTENGNCLCNCTQINLTEDGGGTGDIDYIYIDCNSTAVSGNIPTGGSLGLTCMVTDSLSYVLNGDAAATVTTGAACNAV